MNVHSKPASDSPPENLTLFGQYLARERAFKNIGPNRAASLVAAFGERLPQAILDQEEGVIDIIGEDHAINAAAVLETRMQETAFIGWLESINAGIPTHKATRLARAWGAQGIEAVQQNPYLLLAISDWQVVDRIGTALGIQPNDARRETGAVEAALAGNACLGAGSTLMTSQKALRAAEKLLGQKIAPEVADASVRSGAAVSLAGDLQPPGAAHMEADCALRLSQMGPEAPYSGITNADWLDEIAAAYEIAQPFPLTEAQRDAVRMSHRHRLLVLAGYAGSGKTTVLKGICETQEAIGKTPLIVTLSGRASQRAMEATGRRAITVSRFLIEAEKSDFPLDQDTVLIADEASMLGLVEFWRILRRLGDANLILCGDPAQLPPVSPGVVFHTLAVDHGIRKVVLDRVHRQDERTGIPALAEGVRNGSLPELPNFGGSQPGVTFNECDSMDLCHEITRLGGVLRNSGTDRDDMQIIVPTNREIGMINSFFHQRALKMQPRLWPSTEHIGEGEPVIWTVNDTQRGLTNGALGRVISVDDSRIEVVLDGVTHELAANDGQYLQLAYAISVHKAQGSQWRRVIIPIFRSKIVDRSLIYTALTRAQEQVIFMGSLDAMETAVERLPAAEMRQCGFGRWLSLARQ
ncbi:AAA family ATPase [Ruegeria sp. HKCCD6109]|uniref:AAA family ATPase n=1 Tax=Ruegeria sp. HKCCD6109 TaxID=2683017 RepID=UPI001491D41F|nr:AAA family ATPase [Ruegeria sp. HKCCD6109]NOD62720.1 AAA family ATPase [Ruegeria sp. HKCCD6109]